MKRLFRAVLANTLGSEHDIQHVQAAAGGSINRCYCIGTNKGSFFVKENSQSAYPGMFEAEAKGLKLLSENSSFCIPQVYGVTHLENRSFLVMKYLEPTAMAPNFWDTFAKWLANIHRQSADRFGLNHENYIGSLPQSNALTANWSAFFIGHRLEPQLRQAMDQGFMVTGDIKAFEALCKKLGEFFPKEAPALLHGDLWSGNFMVGPGGQPALVDPAVYYGHRLMDIAMTRLFGGFDKRLYQVYHESYPLQDNWMQATDVCNIYPLLVHVNLFGASYVSQVRNILNRYA